MQRVMCLTTFWFNGRRLVWLVAFCHCLIPFQGKEIVDVRYERKTLEEFMGTPLTLTCSSTYVYKVCRYVEVGWYQNNTLGLTEPSRYLTTVNETILEDKMRRRRQVTTKILRLIREDTGTFQCLARCEDGQQSRGHFIEVIVKDQSH